MGNHRFVDNKKHNHLLLSVISFEWTDEGLTTQKASDEDWLL